jgi:hypothetical protein
MTLPEWYDQNERAKAERYWLYVKLKCPSTYIDTYAREDSRQYPDLKSSLDYTFKVKDVTGDFLLVETITGRCFSLSPDDVVEQPW